MDKSEIANEDFAAALEEAIKHAGVFRQVVRENEAEYLLEVVLVSLEQPMFGLNYEVKLATQWTLTAMKTQKALWQKTIVANHTATVGDAFAGIARLRLANEGAAKKNIQRGLMELSRLDLHECC